MSTTNTVQSLTIEIPGAAPWGLTEEPGDKPGLKPERVQEMLTAAPAWQLLDGTTTLHREKNFPDAMAALLYSSYVSSLAASLRVQARVRVLGMRVLVTLGSARKGRNPLNEAQLALAVMIS
jgi:pterin-4a-carbinolamine dehydratase